MNEQKLISKAMSILGRQMTRKRKKFLREVAAPHMRSFIKPRKLNRRAVLDIRSRPDNYTTAKEMAVKYGVNPTTVIKTLRFKIHKNVK